VVVERRPVEALRQKDVLVRVGYCGVCPWDLRAYLGKSSSVHFPVRFGHEVSGVIEAVGEGVKELAPGDRVLVDVIRRCGKCVPCRRGFENHCENSDYSRGGFAEYIVAPAENIFCLRDSTPLIEAALAEPLACIVRGQQRINASAGDTALVVGCGPLGLLHLQLLKSCGATVIAFDLIDERLETAIEFGADAVANPTRDDLEQIVKSWTEGFGVDVAIIANGEIEAVRQTLPLLGFGGRLLLFAGVHPKTEMGLDPNYVHYREILITGSSDYTRAEFQRALQLIEDGAIQLRPLISDVYSLAEIEQALSTVERCDGLKVVICCNDLDAFEAEVRA
jgi:L-iditol 2-dehydrogenase